jgi:Tfp pilus assembly protein PilV
MTTIIRKFKSRQSGQGLIETIMICVFVGINVVTLLSFQSYLAYSTDFTQQQSYANLLARSEIETLRDYSVLNTTSGYVAYQGIVTSSSAATIGDTAYTINWTVTPAAGLSYDTVNVTVSWTDRHSNAQSISLITNIAGIDPSLAAAFM